jgi:hypothetical protein
MPRQLRKQQQRESSPQGRSPKLQQDPSRFGLQVGEKWPDGPTLVLPAREGVLKTGVIIAIVVLCGALIAVLTLHAMVIGNQQRLDDILKVAWKVLIGFGLWATVAHQWQKVKSIVQKAAIHVLRE